jgi:predicted transcriptional regulator
MKKRLTAVRLKEDHLQELSEIAKRQDVPVSQLIRTAVVDFLARSRKGKK